MSLISKKSSANEDWDLKYTAGYPRGTDTVRLIGPVTASIEFFVHRYTHSSPFPKGIYNVTSSFNLIIKNIIYYNLNKTFLYNSTIKENICALDLKYFSNLKYVL